MFLIVIFKSNEYSIIILFCYSSSVSLASNKMICYLFFLSLLTLARFEGNILSFQEYSVQYLPSTITEEERLQYHAVWKKNVDYIIEHNTKTSDSSFKLGINEFTHLVRISILNTHKYIQYNYEFYQHTYVAASPAA